FLPCAALVSLAVLSLLLRAATSFSNGPTAVQMALTYSAALTPEEDDPLDPPDPLDPQADSNAAIARAASAAQSGRRCIGLTLAGPTVRVSAPTRRRTRQRSRHRRPPDRRRRTRPSR